uniref:E3 ubiquitin-protein ligase PPP1R11 n=1 Tax=Poecilia mexicana TaxID=48701 RepID=A0A3B3YK67_9TELE
TAVNGIGIQLINVEVYLSCLQEGRSLTIKLRKRKTEKKVEWSSDTVDNEHLGRRSSKCESVCLQCFCPNPWCPSTSPLKHSTTTPITITIFGG